ncbi:MAG TPA: zf-TFIIB domain-containing protein [Vicinamibacterales bacterium]|nr:zf-TFIIB domain-containing protein [Vicinamibacterales bacterium]
MADKLVVPNCANCGAPMLVDRAEGKISCSHCGSVELPAGITRWIEAGAGSEMACPSCARPLSHGKLDGFPLQLCPRCEGMLIEMEHFVSVIGAARGYEESSAAIPPRRQTPGDRTIDCPACHRPMLSHFYGGPGNLVIDTCETCQVNWLDAAELRRIARAWGRAVTE